MKIVSKAYVVSVFMLQLRDFKLFFYVTLFCLVVTTGGFKESRGGARPQAPHFWYPEGAPHVEKKVLKKRFFDCKQKKEARRKGINASQLEIRNFNDITGKLMNAPCVFCFYVVFLKSQNISSTFQAQKKHDFFLYS